jgi:hypothetical protein
MADLRRDGLQPGRSEKTVKTMHQVDNQCGRGKTVRHEKSRCNAAGMPRFHVTVRTGAARRRAAAPQCHDFATKASIIAHDRQTQERQPRQPVSGVFA